MQGNEDKPRPGTHVEIVETYADGTVITTAGIVSTHDGGPYGRGLLYIGEAHFPAVWNLQLATDPAAGADRPSRPGRPTPVAVRVTVAGKPER